MDDTLVQVLSRETARDGGASLVVNLKDYDTAIPRLLRKSSVSNKKLLTFLEGTPMCSVLTVRVFRTMYI